MTGAEIAVTTAKASSSSSVRSVVSDRSGRRISNKVTAWLRT